MKIFAALNNDINEGFVWLKWTELRPRSIVKICNPQMAKVVYCEALQLEDNFLKRYNEVRRFKIDEPNSSIVMGGWYRTALGDLQTQRDYPLRIEPAHHWLGKLRACTDHPQVVVRVAASLGLLSLLLGVIGALLGVASVWPKD
jgi:hypothetical protein